MYSKALNNKDMRGGRDIYRRQSQAPPQENVRLPVNYKGTAFNPDGSSRMYVSEASEEPKEVIAEAEKADVQEPPAESKQAEPQNPISDIFKGFGGIVSAKNFPFGHGIGFEELLLIGLLLFISDADENSECAADERDLTRLILTALLICG